MIVLSKSEYNQLLFQTMRLENHVRAAEQREKLAKRQAGQMRIEYEIQESKYNQLQKTHSFALTAKNTKLKSCIADWKKLVNSKDAQLEKYQSDVDRLTRQNGKLMQQLVSLKNEEKCLHTDLRKNSCK